MRGRCGARPQGRGRARQGRGARLGPGRTHGAICSLLLTRLPAVIPHPQVDMATLPYLTLQDLRDLPIHAVGPRRKLLAALERM